MAAPAPSTEYLYTDVEALTESNRLNAQHEWLKTAFDHPDTQRVVPPCIDLSRVHRVLDLAAGIGIWTSDFAEIPCIKSRLANPDAAGEIEIWASDVDMTKFGYNDAFGRLKEQGHVRLIEQDILKPFPEDMRGTVDLVHAAMLVYVLGKEEWGRFLANVREVLRPGGYLILCEGDTAMYSPSHPPPSPGQEHDFARTGAGNSTLAKMSRLYTQSATSRGGFPDLSLRLPALLHSTPLTLISTTTIHAPIGTLCLTIPSLLGSSMASQMRNSYLDAVSFFEVYTSKLLKMGTLEAPEGMRIVTEEGRGELMREFKRELWERGVLLVFSEWVVRK